MREFIVATILGVAFAVVWLALLAVWDYTKKRHEKYGLKVLAECTYIVAVVGVIAGISHVIASGF